VFAGDLDRNFKAVDVTTGKILWQTRLGTTVQGFPMSFSIDGKQYLAVVAGRTKGPPSFFGKIGQRVIDASPEGGVLIVFQL
jgi:alcohol dehydrogenase (cytochrome c)